MKLYSKALLYSFLLHASIALLLLYSPQNTDAYKKYALKKSQSPKKVEIIKASAVDSAQIDSEIKRIKHIAEQKKLNAIKQEKALQKQLAQAKQLKLKEEQEVQALRKEQKKLVEQQEAAILSQRKKMIALKKSEKLAHKRLIESQKARKALDEKLAAEEVERKKLIQEKKKLQAKKALEKRLAEEKRIAEEKKMAELKRQKDLEKQQLVNAEVNQYKSLLINAISQNWILPSNVNYALSCRFEIKLAPSGDVLKVTLLRTSGDPVLDRSAQTAIYNASPLPVPKTPEAFEVFKVVSLTVKPENSY